MDWKLLNWITNNEDLIVPTLFKPVQFKVIKKLKENISLNETEKRYLRGAIKRKLLILEKLMKTDTHKDELNIFLNNIESYYITGLDALKHNGYGWYFETKKIEVINTKIEGRIKIKNKLMIFFRVKSIEKSKINIDVITGMKYANNDQIIKDIRITKNLYVKNLCLQMFRRYKALFTKEAIEPLEK